MSLTKPKWNNIDTVLLDMDGTLLDLHFDNYFWMQLVPKKYSEMHNITFEESFKKLSHQFDEKQGTIDWYCLDYWSNALGLNIFDLKQTIKNRIEIRPYVIEFLTALQNTQKRVILLTNAHGKTLSLKMQETQLSDFFTSLVTTHNYGIPKENIHFWQQFSDDIHLTPHKTLLIDDTLSVLNTAHRFGIGHLLTLKQPDSKKPIRESCEFADFLHFNEIMPNE